MSATNTFALHVPTFANMKNVKRFFAATADVNTMAFDSEEPILLDNKEPINARRIVHIGIGVLTVALLLICMIFHSLGGTSKHLDQIGPSDDLVVLETKINTPARYMGIIAIIGIIYGTRAFIKNNVWSNLKYIFNPYQKTLMGFTRAEYVVFSGYIKFADDLIEMLLLSIVLQNVEFMIFGITINSVILMFSVHHVLKSKNVIP